MIKNRNFYLKKKCNMTLALQVLPICDDAFYALGVSTL